MRTILALLTAGLSLLLAALPAGAQLKPGDPAPDFAADAALGGQAYRFVLADALKKGPVVVYFYPKAFTQGCTIEANLFAEAHDEYAAMGATVIGVSRDDLGTLKRFSVLECRNRFAVASDPDGSIMKSYDAAMPFRTDYARRVSYVIGTDGRVAYTHASASPEEHVPSTLEAVRGLANGRPR